MIHKVKIELILAGDELLPVRFLEWLAQRLEETPLSEYPDEVAQIDKVWVDDRQVVGERGN